MLRLPHTHPPAAPLLPPLRFLRFPGGCYVEGDWLRNAFRWRDSIGANEERPGHLNGERGTGQQGSAAAGERGSTHITATGAPRALLRGVRASAAAAHTRHPWLCGLRTGTAGVWGYWSTDGLGLFEYMLLAEELRTEPVWVINNGVAHEDSEPRPCPDSEAGAAPLPEGVQGQRLLSTLPGGQTLPLVISSPQPSSYIETV